MIAFISPFLLKKYLLRQEFERGAALYSPSNKAEVHHLFNEISPTYDLVNSILSMGMDKHWYKQLIQHIPQDNPLSILDVATGTGSLILAILKAREQVISVGIDIAEHMLEKAKIKAQIARLHNRIQFETANAIDLPFEDHSFDLLTVSFGIRNMSSLEQCFKEMYRVLKPGGKALILEFSMPTHPWARHSYLIYLRHILPKVGKLISKHKTAYTYLNQTIEAFPYGEALCHFLEQAGFKATYKPYTLGVVSLYTAVKPS